MPTPQSSQRAAWKRVFQCFDEACERYVGLYCDRDAEGRARIDVPWFYNERATLSYLAGALWRAHPDNLVLEEYACDKTRGGAADATRGRRDIWFLLEGRQHWGEAKQISGDPDDAEAVLRRAHEVAGAELDAVRSDSDAHPGRVGAGMCFVSWKSSAHDAVLPLLGSHVESLTEFDDEAGVVRHHCFPAALRRLHQAEHRVAPGDRERWHGVTLVLRLDPFRLV